jgi:hypothetical protein
MKVAVIGGGSTYTPELINGFLNSLASFPLTELCLMDINAARLEIVGGFARRMLAARGDPFQLTLSLDQRQALQGAAYVITQLRVGMMEARRADEYLGQRHNLIGQETTGVGGMSKALRTIPVILKIAEDMRHLAPGALLVNFTNPSGLITQALSQVAPDVPAVGVCNAPYNAQMDMLAGLEQATEPSLLAPWLYAGRRGNVVPGPGELLDRSAPGNLAGVRAQAGRIAKDDPQLLPGIFLPDRSDVGRAEQLAAISCRRGHGSGKGFAGPICRPGRG